MLSKEDTELLCRVGPGTAMGNLMREYWLPFLYSWELTPDSPPLRVRLLGEDLVVFRDSNGDIGLLDDHCAHRGASLFYGRNEDCGLRCVYHGWKYDVRGRCVDMPNEPPESNFKDKIHQTAYRCGEQGGVVFAYMGSRQADPPGMPQLEWALLPENQVHHEYKAVLACNYMQALEGDVDSAHIGFLHGRLRLNDTQALGSYHWDRAPRLEIIMTDYGLMYGAHRSEPDGQAYWRTTQYLMPVHTHFPASHDGVVPSHIWVPIDDEHTLVWGVRWHPSREMPGRELLTRAPMAGMGPMQPEQQGRFFSNWWTVVNERNDFMIDRDIQRTENFTGIPTIRLQDAAMTTSMGAVMDRTKEHLGTTDTAIIRARQRLLNAAKALRDKGVTPPGADQPELFRVRSCSAVLPEDADWRSALEGWHQARTNEVSEAQLAGKLP
jgi:phenylpropionate dioxygenase-like ring-hydroxylating dioxygenase large terminal subunit